MKQIFSNKDFHKFIVCGVKLVVFYAQWCASCKSQEPILEKMAQHYAGKAIIASMNIDNNNETAIKLGIKSIPTLIIYKNGKEIQRFIGLQSEEMLLNAMIKVNNY
ncbi:MAG: Thioredoxin [Candidatus Magnetoglobus multicellularis str. Araruama]|uniref:Thioredoxin n=1 Tax=Candidatus Magnetoglobus multicellularis str. Araruama TaxID=890399 RepID=A0A1V1PHY9_9BACT|nr:MAG: Thioredoxin [Candidatus Magnetoglobus multicellularis str. Araruama]